LNKWQNNCFTPTALILIYYKIPKHSYNPDKIDGLLLKKAEELTLFVIQQQKEIDSLKEKLSKLEN
jgi:hypothetical protein